MSEFKGTPGPWHFGVCRKCVPDPTLTCNAVRTTDGNRVPNTPENLRIQAAAPDLLAACVEFVTVMRRGERPDLLSLINAMHAADAALAKATGTGEALP